LLPNTSFRPQLSRAALNELTGFGAKRFISQAGVQAIFQLDRIIVGAFLPIRAVTFYSVPLSITQRFLVFHGSITNTYFPAASELHGLRDTDRLRRLYTTTFKLNAALMLLLVALIASLARPMLDAWLGADFARSSATILVVLAFGYGLTALVGLGGQLSDASGHPGWTATYVVASALTNIILSILLVPRVGAVGAAYALLLQNLVCGVSFLAFSQWRLLHISMVGSLALLIRPLIAAGVVAAAGLAAGSLLHGVLPVIGALLLGTAIYAGLTLVLGTWTQRERRLAKDALLAIFP
jgi:O-antigen/teichoic acid export membrane protein